MTAWHSGFRCDLTPAQGVLWGSASFPRRRVGQLGAHCLEPFPCPANILLWMRRQAGKVSSLKTPMLPRWAPGSRAAATIHVVHQAQVAPRPQRLPHSNHFPPPGTVTHSMGNAGQPVLCHVGGQKPNDAIAPLFTLLWPWSEVASTFYSYLLFLSLTPLSYLTTHPNTTHLKSQTHPTSTLSGSQSFS